LSDAVRDSADVVFEQIKALIGKSIEYNEAISS